MYILSKSNDVQILLYKYPTLNCFSTNIWTVLDFALIHIFVIYWYHTFMICIWFP